ncbi:hypothetical protein G5B88_20785 [Herbaspirillum seropedicae]|uniref:hypothetical protein n=1 Tax=Herbaspirillum seropedicae TaxID=964 RepID=UPI00059D31C5|nr:hypothetical protein [Herbaspirillum seropedicae]AKN67396.1 hypothetical protein ACP92_20480 [Herbaspirillum seropedicae]NQE31988.1 hypothetical protein [Herbaspirillum seropedicae]UMU23404.1 hypothetical protein G5B88_20785 [Herbaspirillum seropedicae]
MAWLKSDSPHKDNGRLPEIIWKNGRSWVGTTERAERLAVVEQHRMLPIHFLMRAFRRYAELLENQGIRWSHFSKDGANAVRINEKQLVESSEIPRYTAAIMLHSVFKLYKFAKQQGLVKAELSRDILTKLRQPVLKRFSKTQTAPKYRIKIGR